MSKISIIISFRNEKDNINKFVQEVEASFSKNKNYEMIFVDDNSSDGSLEILLELIKKNKNIKIIKMKKRFGHSNCIQAGLENISNKNYCVLIDCDLQDPPSLINENLNINDNINTIHFVRKSRDDSYFQKIYTSIAYKILKVISGGKIIESAGYFKIIPPNVTEKLKKDEEYLPYWNYLITKYSIKNKLIYYTRGKRFKGESKFNIFSLNPWMTYFGGLYHFKYNFIFLASITIFLLLILKSLISINLIAFLSYTITILLSLNLIFFIIYIFFKKRRKKIICEYNLINFNN